MARARPGATLVIVGLRCLLALPRCHLAAPRDSSAPFAAMSVSTSGLTPALVMPNRLYRDTDAWRGHGDAARDCLDALGRRRRSNSADSSLGHPEPAWIGEQTVTLHVFPGNNRRTGLVWMTGQG